MSSLVEKQREQAKKLKKTICLAEAVLDPRTMKAARMFMDEGLGTPLIIGSPIPLTESATKAHPRTDPESSAGGHLDD